MVWEVPFSRTTRWHMSAVELLLGSDHRYCLASSTSRIKRAESIVDGLALSSLHLGEVSSCHIASDWTFQLIVKRVAP